MTDTSEEDSHEEELAFLESEAQAALKVLGGHKSPCVNGIATETESVKSLTRTRQQIWKTKPLSTDWKHSTDIPMFKTGDAKERSN